MATDRVSAYAELLPALFQGDQVIGAVMLSFERLYVGTGEGEGGDPVPGVAGFERVIDELPGLFEPLGERARTPAAMLPWLAGWVGVSLVEDWPEATRRRFIQSALRLYQRRGTPAGLAEMLELHLGRVATVEDQGEGFPPFYFEVTVRLDSSDPRALAETDRIARAVIEREKPAHTVYGLRLLMPSMQLVSAPADGQAPLILGENTLLGTTSV